MARKVDPEKRRARRQQISDAAAVLFATKGFDGTTTAQICQAAGVSAGHLYHYFSSKREIFAAIVSDGQGETTEVLASAASSDRPLEALLDVVDHLAAPAAEPIVPSLVLEAMLQAYRDPELAALMERNSADEQAGIAVVLRRAHEAGEIDPELDVEDMAAWIMALIGALYLQGATDPAFEPARQRAALRLTVERLLVPRPERGRPSGRRDADAAGSDVAEGRG